MMMALPLDSVTNVLSYLTPLEITKVLCNNNSTMSESIATGLVYSDSWIGLSKAAAKEILSNNDSSNQEEESSSCFSYLQFFSTFANAPPSVIQSTSVTQILNYFTTFVSSPDVTAPCLIRLFTLLSDEDIRKSSDISLVLTLVQTVMNEFEHVPELQVLASKVIVVATRPVGATEGRPFNTTSSSSNVKSTNDKRQVLATQVLRSMKIWENSNSAVLASCSWALVNLSLSPVIKAKIITEGGITAVSNAMKKYRLDRQVQLRGLFALINLVVTSNNEEGDVVLILERILSDFEEDDEICALACILIKNMSISRTGLPVLARSNDIQVKLLAIVGRNEDDNNNTSDRARNMIVNANAALMRIANYN